jgi:hypothetical protein
LGGVSSLAGDANGYGYPTQGGLQGDRRYAGCLGELRYRQDVTGQKRVLPHARSSIVPDMIGQARKDRDDGRGVRQRVREEVIAALEREVRTRLGTGRVPSCISLDLSFVRSLVPAPPKLGPYEIPPLRDADRVARAARAFAMLEEYEAVRRAG